jgi:DHA2 family multidrug resistance protein
MVGTAVVTAFGAVSYGVTALLPLFLQTLLGYPALQAGLVTSPRGLGSIAAMLAAGRLMGIIDGRVLIAAGFTAVAYSSVLLGGLNVEVAPSNVIWPAVINGFGTALIFAPLATLTMATLRNEQLGNATGIFNLMRNLGGSIGIATVTTLLDRRSQTHTALMVGHLAPSQTAYRTTLQALAGGLASKVGNVAGAGKAYALLYGELLRQARLWAFVDDFRLMATLAFLCVLSAVLFRRATSTRAVTVH